MTNIWWSFVAAGICAANGWNILFHSSSMFQERNPHDLMFDFRDEISDYIGNADICKQPDALDIKSGVTQISAGLRTCYESFVRSALLDRKELPLLESWLKTVGARHYCTVREEQ